MCFDALPFRSAICGCCRAGVFHVASVHRRSTAQTGEGCVESHTGRAGALGKLAIDRSRKQRLTEAREVLEGKVASQLQEFKALHQSTFRGASRLGYPRTLRAALPWIHGLLHSSALRGAADVNADERCALMTLLMVRSPAPPPARCSPSALMLYHATD